jgi:hypothetical protein
MLENLPVPHIERFYTSKFIKNSPLLVLKICWVLLVVIFSTKLVSPHSEFSRKSYCYFLAYPGSIARATSSTARLRLITQEQYYHCLLPVQYRSGVCHS